MLFGFPDDINGSGKHTWAKGNVAHQGGLALEIGTEEFKNDRFY